MLAFTKKWNNIKQGGAKPFFFNHWYSCDHCWIGFDSRIAIGA
jgi:hypothetical protein